MMTTYGIYGIGNALVDYEIEVLPEQLAELGVEKGVTTLIDEARQNELMRVLNGTLHSRACGGSAANTLIGFASLGGRAYYSCKVASDETGDFYAADLARNGVASSLADKPRPAGVTGKCLVMVTPDADRTMNTFLGVTGDIGPEDIRAERLAEAEWAYIEGYLVSAPRAFEAAKAALKLARQQGVKTALSFSDPAMTRYFGEQLKTLLAEPVDLLFCNEAEALDFTGCASLDDAFEALKASARAFAITRGPEGAWLFDGQARLEVLPHPVKAIDTNGAGDLFAGAFLAALTQGFGFARAGELASFASAKLVTQFGPRLHAEHLAEVQAFYRAMSQDGAAC